MLARDPSAWSDRAERQAHVVCSRSSFGANGILLALALALHVVSCYMIGHVAQAQQEQQKEQHPHPRGLHEDQNRSGGGNDDGDGVKGPFVYTYDFGTMYTEDQLELHVSWYSEQYNTERIVPELMRAAGVATRDPEKASLFFVPLYASWHWMYHMGLRRFHDKAQRDARKIWQEVLTRVRQEFPYFNRTNGRDHFGVLAFDGGRCDMLTHLPPHLYGDMFFLTHNGDQLAMSKFEGMAYAYEAKVDVETPAIPCFIKGHDIVVPVYIDGANVVRPQESTRNIWFGLRFSATMPRGSGLHYSHRLRTEIHERYGHARMEGWDFTNKGRFPTNDWANMTFAACPPGRTQWTSRPFKALIAGAVPITFFRFHENPFEDVLRYDSFSVNVEPDDVARLGSIMQALKGSPETVRRLQDGVAKVQEHFVWSTDPSKGASRLVIDSLRRRAKELATARSAPGSISWSVDQEEQQAQEQRQQTQEEEKEASVPVVTGDGGLRNRSTCDGRRIHMLLLPPRFNSDLELQYHERDGVTAVPDLQWMASFSRNRGFGASPYRGRPVHFDMSVPTRIMRRGSNVLNLLENTWFHTSPHSLEAIFRWRMEEYDCLVGSHEDADWVYVPYYGQLDMGRHAVGDAERRDRLGKDLAAWLQQQPSWQRSRGADHFLVLGSGSSNFRRAAGWTGGPGTSLLTSDGMEEVVVLSVNPGVPSQRDVGVPRPTPFHPSSWAKVQLWQDAVRRHRRTRLLLFYVDGTAEHHADEPMDEEVLPLRRLPDVLRAQCEGADNSTCYFVSKPQVNRTILKHATSVHWLNPVLMSLSTKFCLHPFGSVCMQDALLVQSLLAGCIPVILQECDLPKHLPWHAAPLQQPFYVYFPAENVLADLEKGGSSNSSSMGLLVRKLEEMPEGTLTELREAGLELIPRLTYGGSIKAGGGISPPDFADAFDLAIGGLQDANRNQVK